MSYLGRRLLLSAALLLALSLAAFLLLSVAPGHFLSAELMDPQRSPAAVAEWVRTQGLDRPWPVRYAGWLRSCAVGSCGTSLGYGLPVSGLIAARLPRTVAIVIPAWVAGWTLGLAAAWLCAWRRPLRQAAEPALVIAGMLPEVVSGSLLLWLAVGWGLPVEGAWLPVLILTISLAAVVFLHASDALAEAHAARFVRMAEARGIAGWTLWYCYVLPAAANPLVSLLGPSLAGVAGSALAAEALTGWPGLGPLFLDAFQMRDYPVVQAVLVLLGALLTVASLAGDLLLYRLDARIRTDGEQR